MPPALSTSLPPWLALVHRHRALLVPIAFVALLVILIVPLSPVVMDLLIAVNISIAVIVLMTTMYMNQPLDFSVFPSLLLATTLFRLVLNIASTRLILTADANSPQQAVDVAGKVIAAFGQFVAGGSLVVGLILFVIIFIVQFVVITKGATRISEVAARFTLDAMPGKQMAIDADLNAGIINEQQARERREKIAREADFFGAMDGASKFVRGDAIAGIIITAINIVGGFAIGALDKGWPVDQTARIFTILTIGDGLSSQIPAFVISIAAALIVTRSSSKESLGSEMTGQLTSRPVALGITAAFVGALAFTPLPKVPLILLALIFGGMAFFSVRQSREAERAAHAAAAAPAAPPAPPVEDLLKVDTLELEVGYGLVALVDVKQGGDLLERIAAIRRQLAADLGLVMPPVRVRDNMTLSPAAYRFKIRGNVVAEGETRPGLLLAMDSGIASGKLQGIPTKEPAFGLDAWWIEPGLKQRAETLNYTVVDATSVLTTHLAEMVKAHADELLTREEVNNLLTQLKGRAGKLVEDTIPGQLPVGELQKILQNLLRERVPIRDMETILETISDWAAKTKDTEVLTEYVRNALRRTICRLYAVPIDAPAAPVLSAQPAGGVPAPAGASRAKMRIVCVTLDPAFEDFIGGYIDRSPAGTTITMPARVASLVARRIIDALAPVTGAGHAPVVIASPQVRAQVRQILEPYLPAAVVLGYNEIVPGIEVQSMALVTVPEEQPQGVGAAA